MIFNCLQVPLWNSTLPGIPTFVLPNLMNMFSRKLRLLTILVLFVSTTGIAQNKPVMDEPYAVQWKKADSLLDRGLPQSALSIVDKVYTEAKTKSQPVQVLKAQLYLLRIDATNREDADSLNIAQAETQARTTAFPVKAVWQSIAAQLYWQYYQSNRYKILSRTRTAEAAGVDFAQWDASKFFEKSAALYLQSVSDAEALKEIRIDSYDPILIKGENTRTLRPTLFDLLAFRAIAFFSNEEKDITRPAFLFIMDDAAAFAPAAEFIRHRFAAQDSMSMQYRALTLYQEVLRLHEQDATADAFIDADLQRLEFAYAHSVHPEKKTLYREALSRIERIYSSHPLSATASFRIASLMMDTEALPLDGDEDGSDDRNRTKTDLRAVKAKLDSIIAKYPASEGGISAQHLRQSILAPSLSLTAEEAVLPDGPSKVLLTYKNTVRAFVRVVKMDADDYRIDNRRSSESLVKELLASKPLQAFSVALPGTEDYHQHSAEVKIDALPAGMYAVLISGSESFAQKDNALSYAVFQSTRLAVVMPQQTKAKNSAGFILDRKDGTPVAKATIAFFTEKWNNSARQYDYVQTPNITTGTDGAFHAPAVNQSYNGLVVRAGADAFYTADYLSFYQYDGNVEANEQTFFFTDRSIYRPGQTIYFKGIVVRTEKDRRSSNVVAARNVTVTFYDANGQKIADQNLTSNEWGSITGKFTAPQSGLTGAMRIEGGNGTAYISVEEYKRPKFRVDWDTLKSDYALNETVVVTGHALAYAGNNVDGGAVKYRVVRQARFPYWWYAWRWGGPDRSPQQEIAQGIATTDADGKFSIRFQTLPDRSIDERALPVFTYTVYADVTDLNGETRSGEQQISAGYRSIQFSTTIPERASRKDLDTLHITTQNLNGTFVATNVKIKIARLNQPDVVYRKRLWAVPDQAILSEAEFRRHFPLDAFKDEDDYRKWAEAEIVLERSMTTTASGDVALPSTAFFRNSWYVITLSAKDKNGRPVEEKKFVQVWDETAEDRPYAALLVVPQAQQTEPGAHAMVYAVSGMNDVHVIRQVQTMGDAIATTQFDLKGSDASAAWQKEITEADRGGIALSFLTVKDNRVYTQSAGISVPWTNKDLSIEWATHRNKLLPGSTETWTMVIRGNKKDKVAAELAAALYDASLDAFKPHGWAVPGLFPVLNSELNWQTHIGFGQAQVRQLGYFSSGPLPTFDKRYDRLMVSEDYGPPRARMYKNTMMVDAVAAPMAAPQMAAGRASEAKAPAGRVANQADGGVVLMEDPITGEIRQEIGYRDKVVDGDIATTKDIPIRKNLQETAFFYPQLQTDAEGTVRIQFTIPEALTEWKLLAFAHTKDMRSGYLSGSVKTQKDLMVQPGLPRFLRQGDEITLSTKIVNLSEAALSGTATLEILDALTMKPIPLPFRLTQTSVPFSAAKGGSTSASWTVHVPESRYEPVIIRITARAGAFTDGEESALPVLTNRMLVTETLPMWMNGAGTKSFHFDKLLQSASSNTLAQHRLTLEYTGNPAWYAVKALPYLMEYPYECAEQTFNRYYANALAAHILDKAPRVKEIFRKWEAESMLSSFKSPLEQNQELKSALLEETPWVLDAQNESEQRKNISMLFQTAKLARDLDQSARKLEDLFLSEGGWPWFKGDPRPDRYITQYIITGIGRLQHLGIEPGRLASLTERALPYLDRKMQESYKELIRRKANMKEQQIGYMEIQYLYMRSFFLNVSKTEISADASAFYRKQAQQFWPKFNPYLKGMIALALHRSGDVQTTKTIIQSLKETALQKEELGMYWMDRGRSWWWWEAPIEAQSLLIECFAEVAADNESVDKMKRWLLKQKQTQSWLTTKATADACYALLLQGTQWLSSDPQVTVQLGDETIRSQDMKAEAGSGYFKVQYPGADIKPDLGNITLTVANESTSKRVNEPTNQPSWGAIYWQYFENLDKITSAATPLVVKKQLFIERNSDRGPVLEAVSGNASLKIGDKVKARIEIIVDRDMEYVHLKDGRASCFEPVNVLSGYRWQGGLGYYESTRDASSNFFFSYLPKGKYVFEYPMFVTSAGDFSNGIATIQCMYAPEFSAHSEGLRVRVK